MTEFFFFFFGFDLCLELRDWFLELAGSDLVYVLF